MKEMNLDVADILQRIWKAYIIDKSWRPAVKGTRCQYALINKAGKYVPNKACFVGFFIPREEKFHDLLVAQGSIKDIYDKHQSLVLEAFDAKKLTEEDIYFLNLLQFIHDDAAIKKLGYDFLDGGLSEMGSSKTYNRYLPAMKTSLENFASLYNVELEPAA